jgi:hypothetical protein
VHSVQDVDWGAWQLTCIAKGARKAMMERSSGSAAER